MIAELERLNSKLGSCLSIAFFSASLERKEKLFGILKKTAISIEDVFQNPIKIPCYLLMKISKELGANQSICEIIMTYQLNRIAV